MHVAVSAVASCLFAGSRYVSDTIRGKKNPFAPFELWGDADFSQRVIVSGGEVGGELGWVRLHMWLPSLL